MLVAWELPATLAAKPLQAVMSGGVVGHGYLALTLSVVSSGRALPLCRVVVSVYASAIESVPDRLMPSVSLESCTLASVPCATTG